jgi:hypothetical protein
MRIFGGIIVSLALLMGSAQAETGRTTDKTYKTMTAAAKAGGAFLWSKYNHRAVHASDVSVGSVSYHQGSKMRTVSVGGPRTPMGYREGFMPVKVEKVKGGYKAFTDTKIQPTLLK